MIWVIRKECPHSKILDGTATVSDLFIMDKDNKIMTFEGFSAANEFKKKAELGFEVCRIEEPKN